jgi:putative sterol carrier protein
MGANYMDIADEVLEMLRNINKKLRTQNSKLKTETQKLKLIKTEEKNLKVNLDKWQKISVAEAFEKYVGISKKNYLIINYF